MTDDLPVLLTREGEEVCVCVCVSVCGCVYTHRGRNWRADRGRMYCTQWLILSAVGLGPEGGGDEANGSRTRSRPTLVSVSRSRVKVGPTGWSRGSSWASSSQVESRECLKEASKLPLSGVLTLPRARGEQLGALRATRHTASHSAYCEPLGTV